MMIRRSYLLVFTLAGLISVLVSAGHLHAETPDDPSAEFPGDIETDRPDQTETPNTIPPGYFQLETGWTHEENRESGEDSRADSVFETLLRIGLAERLELRLVTQGYQWERLETDSAVDHARGWGDAEIGFKGELWEESGVIPEAGFIAHLTLPTGDDDFSTHRADPSFRFSFAHTLTDRLSFGYNLGAAWETAPDDSGGRDTLGAFQYTAALGYDLTEKLGIFAEFFGDAPLHGGLGAAHSFDGGITWLVRPNLQLDAAAGVGLTHEAPDWFVGVGLSWRWPR